MSIHLLSRGLMVSAGAPPAARITKVGSTVTGVVAVGTVGTSENFGISGVGAATGDLVVVVSGQDSTRAFGTGTGGGISDGTDGWASITNTTAQFAYKVMGGTPDTTVPIWYANREQPVIAFALRGQHGTPLDTYNNSNGTSGAAPDPASVTTNFDDSLRIITASVPNGNTTGWVAPSGFSGLVDKGTDVSGSNGSTVIVAFQTTPGAAGALDPDAFTGVTPDGTAAYRAIHFAIRKA